MTDLHDTEIGMRRDNVEIGGLDIHKRVQDLDDDGKPKRSGTVWTASAHIITAVIGSGVLSLAWAVAQLGWIAGSVALFVFSFVTYFTSNLLVDCYRSPDPVFGKRNYSYMEAVRANLGGVRYMICGVTQYVNIIGIAIGYTITASISMVAVKKSNCFHFKGHQASCNVSNDLYMISFGIVEILLSQIPNIHDLSWLSAVAAIMSFGYAFIGVALSIAKIISGNTRKTTLGGVEISPSLNEAQKAWNVFRALGDIAFAYSFSLILIEVQDTLRAPSENKLMKKANLVGISSTTVIYVMCGCVGYAAFGNDAPGNMLTGFGFYEPFWLVDIANVFIVVHLVGAFQLVSQPLFAAVETCVARRWPDSKLITAAYTIRIKGTNINYRVNFFRLVWRTLFVVAATALAMAMPFFNDILALLGAIGYWPLTVYFPIEMYIAQKKIQRFSFKWIRLQTVNLSCLLVALAAACGSVQGVTKALHVYKPFKS
ncbi:Amino acid permease 6 [Ranunculus cassubicifolius]